MDIEVVDFPETKIAFLEHKGNPSKVLETANQFKLWRIASGLSPIATSQTYGIPFSDPKITSPDEFRWHVCGTVTECVPENTYGVKNGLIPAGLCAVIRHVGPQNGMDDKIIAVYQEWLPDSGYQTRSYPCFFHYVKMRHQVSEDALETDIYIPIV